MPQCGGEQRPDENANLKKPQPQIGRPRGLRGIRRQGNHSGPAKGEDQQQRAAKEPSKELDRVVR